MYVEKTCQKPNNALTAKDKHKPLRIWKLEPGTERHIVFK